MGNISATKDDTIDGLRSQVAELRKENHSWKYIYKGLRHAAIESIRSEDEQWSDSKWSSARHEIFKYGFINERDSHIDGLVNGIIPPLLSPARILMSDNDIEKILEATHD